MGWLWRDDVQLGLYAAVAAALIAMPVVEHVLKWRRRAAREARVSGRLRELRERVWAAGAICGGLAPASGVLLARAERQARAAAAAEDQARACIALLLDPKDKDAPPPDIAELAADAEHRLAIGLDRVRHRLPPTVLADFEEAQAAWSAYRDHHVRLCRELPGDTADRWPVRHLASEALTSARIDDLEDLLGVCRLGS